MAQAFLQYSDADRLAWTSPLDFLVELFRWLMILGIAAVVLVGMHAVLGERPGREVAELAVGQVVTASEPSPPDDNAAWATVELPEDWHSITGERPLQRWYRLTTTLAVVPSDLWAVYLPSLSMNAEVWVNGVMVGRGGTFGDNPARHWSRPLYFSVPPDRLMAGENTVHVRVAAQPRGTGLLVPLYLGPDQLLRPFWQRRLLAKSTVPLLFSLATGLLAAAAGLIYLNRPIHPVYKYFAIGTLSWSLHNFMQVPVYAPMPPVIWDLIWFLTMGWFVLMIPPFVHGLLGYARKPVERALFAFGLAGSMALAVLAAWDHYWMDWVGRHIWESIILTIGLYPTLLMMLAVWRSREIEVQWLMTTGLLIFVLGCHDWAAINGLIPRSNGFLIQFSAPLVLGVFGWLLIARYVASLAQVEELNTTLQTRIDQRTAELEASFAKLGDMQQAQAIQTERERILRDMHDGVGGSLTAAVAIAEAGNTEPHVLAESLRDTLDELRITIDALDLEAGDLPAAIGNLRARLRPLMEQGTPCLHWVSDELPAAPQLGPEKLTDLVRILREAISNALRHAAGNNIWVRIQHDADAQRVRFEVEDDGAGMDSLENAGHGLANMRRRADGLGGNFEILSSRSGTRVVLSVPSGS